MTYEELKERQKWTLNQKIDHSLGVIDQFISRLDKKVYVAFSGGKDSTVLLDLCRIIYPDIKAVFCNTGNEYPDIVRFVRETKLKGVNIEIIYPELKPYEVFRDYGFPLVSKEQSSYIYEVRTNPHTFRARRSLGLEVSAFKGQISKKWMSLLYKKYTVSHKCCDILKKNPFHKYEKENKVYPILGVMASESEQRKSDYINQGGCNVFGDKNRKTKSLPLSIWTEQDILDYIKMRDLPISDIYHKGAKRTGCMFCGYGCQFKDDNRLRIVYNMYPKMYDKFMNYTNNGITYKEALRDVLKVNNLYLPDEEPRNLFSDIF